MTALAKALIAAGYETASERLERIASEAWKSWPKAADGHARRDYVVEHLRGELTFALVEYSDLQQVALDAWKKWSDGSGAVARRDYVASRLQRDLTWALIEKWQPPALTQAVGFLLNQAKLKIEAERPKPSNTGKPVALGHVEADNQQSRAEGTSSRDEAREIASRSESASVIAAPSWPAPTAPNLFVLAALADKQAARAETATKVQLKLCRLDTVLIDGTPIGDCTVAMVRAWADRRGADQREAARDVRFAMSLVGANLGSNEIVRNWIKPEEADKLYNRAEAEYAA